MSDFNTDNAVPVTTENGQEIRSVPFSLNNAVPDITPPREPADASLKGQQELSKVEDVGIGALKGINVAAQVIRYPFARFIEHPISTLATAMQEPQGKTVLGTLGKAAEVFEPKAIQTKDLNTYGQIWNNYYKSIMKTDAPEWYTGMASYGTAMGVEPPIISGAMKGAEQALTRVATDEEAATIQKTFQPLKDSLSKMGVDTKTLHPEGNIVTLSNGSELYFNNRISAVLRGDEIRIPRWAKVMPQDAPVEPAALPLNHLETLPVTTKSIVPTSSKPVGPDLKSEFGQVTVPPVDEFIKKSTETIPTATNMQNSFTQLKTQAAADDLRSQQLLKKISITPQDAEALYHHQENPQEPLNEEQQKIYDETIKPLADKSAELFAKIRNNGIPIPSEGYTPRFVENKGNALDRIKENVNSSGGVSGLLKKTSGSFKKRTMKVLIDNKGNRQVVSIKGDQVIAWTDKESTALGKINSQEMQELLAKETAPLERQIKKLETEEKILMANKYRAEATRYSIRDIQNKIMDLHSQVMDKNWQYNPDNMEMKVFVDKNGKRWSVGEGTTREIERHTNLTYHKNALLNNLIHYNELRKIDRATEYLEKIKNDPEFQKFSMKAGTGNPPPDWKMTSLPQFRGYYLEPRIADTFDHFNKQLYKGRDPLAVFTSLNRFLRTSIFFNPLIHIPNIATHWATARGASGLLPTTYLRLAKTSGRAIQAVLSQNKDYLDMLDSGVNLMSHTQGEDLRSMMLDKMGQELRANDKIFQKVKKALGYINPYNISGKITWVANDVATLQAIYEQEELGKTRGEAVEEVGKHIPNYVVPARILNSRFLSEVMTNPNITMFGAYHYGALKSYGEMAKSLLGKVPLKERLEAADKLAMLGIILFALYPMLDEALKKATGNPNAHIRRAGSTTLPENIGKLEKGQIDFAQVIQSVLTPAVGAKEAIELGFNKDLFTGEKIIHRGMEAEGLKKLAVESIAPLNAIARITDKKITLNDYLLSMAGVSMSDPNKGKLYNMKDSKASFQKEFDKMYAENPEKATIAAQKFNDKQIKDLQMVVKEEGLKEIPQSVVHQFIITSVGTEKAPKKDAGEMLQKPHHQKRKKFSIRNEE